VRSFIGASTLAFAVSFGFGIATVGHAAVQSRSDQPIIIKQHLGNALHRQKATFWNEQHAVTAPAAWSVQRPFAEFEKTGFVAISGENDFELGDLRLAIAKNLPKDATLIVYVYSKAQATNLQQEYGQYLGSRLKFVLVPKGDDPIWARDSLPVPVYLQPATDSASTAFGLVASIYPQNFDPNAAVARALALPSVSTHLYFRGGNLLVDENGHCFAEDVNEVADLDDPVGFLQQYFGCATVDLLDQEGGIGDIDERIKFLGNNVVLTDDDSYGAMLEDKGYDVRRVTTTGREYETYMNALLVNGTVFVPQMGLDSDARALQAYRDAGLKAVGVYTKQLADYGEGNIHCVTINYPAGTFTESLTNPGFMEFATLAAH